MKFNITLSFYKNDDTINFTEIPASIQKEILDSFKTAKFKNYLEKNISNMGSACKNKVSHYLKLKIKKIKATKTKPFLGFFGKDSINLEIESNISQVKKKVVAEQWCGKELNSKEIKELFNEDNMIEHIDDSLKQLSRGDPFKKFDKKYYFYLKSAFLE
jgi:hypothetical protein